MKTKVKFIIAAACAALAILWTVLVLKADVAPIGPEGSVIGLSHINQAVHALFGDVKETLYKATDITGYLIILCGSCFALIGAIQLFKNMSFKKVDTELYALGGMFITAIVLYVVFEKVVVNYRPVIMPGETELEASYPSSHSMLSCVICGGMITVLKKYIKNDKLRIALTVACAAMMVFVVVGRLVSGAHWYSDIVASMFISGAVIAAFSGLGDVLHKRRKAERKAEKKAEKKAGKKPDNKEAAEAAEP